MEDIFYFSKTSIRLEDIATLAQACGYVCKYYTYSVCYLNVYYEDQGFWQWSELKASDGDFDSFDPPQKEKIAQFQLRSEGPQVEPFTTLKGKRREIPQGGDGPVSAFMISYQVASLPKLLWFLKLILGRYGGWVGCDDGNFKVTLDFENIEKLRCPDDDF